MLIFVRQAEKVLRRLKQPMLLTGQENKNANPKVGVSVVFVVGRAGFEPATNGLKVRCSTS